MSAPTPDKATPSSAELRRAAEFDRFAASKLGMPALASLREQNAARLDAAADAMDSLAAVTEQRDRLAEALRGTLGVVLELLRRTSAMPEGIPTTAMVRAIEAARAALAELEGGAS